MGVLTDYFIARDDRDAARAHKSTGGPKGLGFETAQWKTIDPVVTLATLDEVVTGRDALEWIRSGAPDSRIAGSDGDEHWVFRVYDHHRAVLESIRDDQIKDVARRWGATEELADWETQDVEEILRDLVRLSRIARETGQGLFCWVSL